MLDRMSYGPSTRAAGDVPIAPVVLALDYPGGRADLWLARLNAPARDLSHARAALARRLIAWRTRCEEGDVVIARDAAGAPRIVAPDPSQALSLAGRDDLVAAAVANSSIGIDVETMGAPFAPPLNVLHPAERAALARAGTDAHDLFLRIWTAKEAYVKALGSGLSREPAEIEIRLAASIATFDDSESFDIFDRGDRVATLLARAGRATVRRQPAMLACVVLARQP